MLRAACLTAALVIWLTGLGRGRQRVLLWLDAVGLAAYSVVGAAKALALKPNPTHAAVAPALAAEIYGLDILAEDIGIYLPDGGHVGVGGKAQYGGRVHRGSSHRVSAAGQPKRRHRVEGAGSRCKGGICGMPQIKKQGPQALLL